MDNEERLQKYLATCGIASRRKAEELIKDGKVIVNGKVITEMGFKVSKNDVVKVDGNRIKKESKLVYIVLNKPKGYITTVKDQFDRPTVLDLVNVDERVYPVGRLDYDTSGMIILTNDGDLTNLLTHPKHHVKKTYIANIKGTPSQESIEKFRNGLKIEDYTTSKADFEIVRTNESTTTVKIVISEGKNRQIRKMCDSIGHRVTKLKRIKIGSLELGLVKEGEWTYLTEEEVKLLFI